MLHRWDPFAELSRLQDEVARAGAPSFRRTERTFQPAVDIFEEKEAIVVRAELPGVRSEDISITVENDLLTLAGERKLERPRLAVGDKPQVEKDESHGFHRVEMVYGTFTRSFALPKTVAADAIEANLDAGILTVRLPKRQEAKPRKIDVKIGGGAKVIDAKA